MNPSSLYFKALSLTSADYLRALRLPTHRGAHTKFCKTVRASRVGWPCVCELAKRRSFNPNPPGTKLPPRVRALIQARTRQALTEKKAAGWYIGRPPYGSVCKDGTLLPNPQEQAVIREISCCFSGGMTPAAIARHLTRSGVQPPKGTLWYSTTVRRILKRANIAPEESVNWNPERALRIARYMREEKRSYRQIAVQLARRGLTPKRGGSWHASTVRELLQKEGGLPGKPSMTTATDSPRTDPLCRTCGNHHSEGPRPNSWVWTKDHLPERVPNRSYSQVTCLVWYKNEVQILVYNHEHRCWDDETGDDYVCDPMDVEAWMPLPDPPETAHDAG